MSAVDIWYNGFIDFAKEYDANLPKILVDYKIYIIGQLNTVIYVPVSTKIQAKMLIKLIETQLSEKQIQSINDNFDNLCKFIDEYKNL